MGGGKQNESEINEVHAAYLRHIFHIVWMSQLVFPPPGGGPSTDFLNQFGMRRTLVVERLIKPLERRKLHIMMAFGHILVLVLMSLHKGKEKKSTIFCQTIPPPPSRSIGARNAQRPLVPPPPREGVIGPNGAHLANFGIL